MHVKASPMFVSACRQHWTWACIYLCDISDRHSYAVPCITVGRFGVGCHKVHGMDIQEMVELRKPRVEWHLHTLSMYTAVKLDIRLRKKTVFGHWPNSRGPRLDIHILGLFLFNTDNLCYLIQDIRLNWQDNNTWIKDHLAFTVVHQRISGSREWLTLSDAWVKSMMRMHLCRCPYSWWYHL